jgi:PAS domain S-box-containing protein
MDNRRILVVDDERIVAQDIIEVLNGMGCQVVGTALSGEEAIAKAGEFRPDLILMDITLQGQMDGVEAASIIRREYDIPCVFLTAYSDRRYLERAKLTLPAGYMVKPFEEAALRSTVEIALYKVDLERALKESNEWLQTTLMSIGDGVVATTPQGIVEFMNPLAERLTGWSKDTAKGRTIQEVLELRGEASGHPIQSPVFEAIRTGLICPLEGAVLAQHDGTALPIDASGAPILSGRGEVLGAVLVFRDVTAQRNVQRAMRDYQSQLETQVQTRTQELELANQRMKDEVEERKRLEKAANYRAERESLLRNLSSQLVGNKEQESADVLATALESLGLFLQVDTCYLLEEGTNGQTYKVDLEWRQPNLPPAARATPFSLAPRDLPLIASPLQGIATLAISQEGGGGEVATHPLLAQARQARSVLLVEIPQLQGRRCFLGVDTILSQRRWQEADATMLAMAAEPIVSYISRRRMEANNQALQGQLNQAQKMEAVGKLSSGIAHDFNNMLLPIIGYADMVLARLGEQNENAPELREIRRVAQQAATLTRQLLSFSKKQVIKKSIFSPNEALKDMQKMLQRIIGEDLRLEIQMAPDLMAIQADVGQLEQVIMNLCVNARDAMPQGGKIHVTTRNVQAANAKIPLIGGRIADSGEFVCISVRDNGTGIPPEVAERIFEPFFTTKGQEGTGLGLAVIYGILQEHQGGIDLETEVGRGTCFHIYYPAVRAEIPKQPTAEPQAGGAAPKPVNHRGIGQHVLLVEDEESVNRLVRTALSQNGYLVTSANCVQDAVQKFQSGSGRFDMIFSDAVLPDGNGVELIAAFRHQNPALRVILSSGYTDRHQLMELAKQQQISFLAKPYSLPKLFQTVAEVMEDQRSHMLV